MYACMYVNVYVYAYVYVVCVCMYVYVYCVLCVCVCVQSTICLAYGNMKNRRGNKQDQSDTKRD